jgi:hypothetical protein
MKTKICLIGILYSFSIFSQPYGEIDFNNGSLMTSCSRTSKYSNGYLLAGLKTAPIIRVDKTDGGGSFGSSNSFQKDYYLYNTGECFGTEGYDYNCVGVSAIEIRKIYLSNTLMYAMVGATTDGCFLALLSANGTSYLNKTYPFLYTSSRVEKPVVMQTSNKQFIIAGQFDTSMYVLRVDTLGAVVWSSYYNCGYSSLLNQGGIFNPKDLMISPFNGDLLIVGKLDPSPSYNRASDGFFLSLNPTTGGVNSLKSYGGYAGTSSACNHFNSIRPAYSSAGGGQGYVLGGYSDPINSTPMNTGHAWMIKLGTNGLALWNRLYTPSFDSNVGEIKTAIERYKWNGNTEYYGIAQTNVGVVDGLFTFKLDNTGQPINVTQSTKNSEFYYNKSTAFYVKGLTFADSVSADEGLQLFADNSSNHYMMETYFNGANGCGNENITNIQAYENGPGYITPWISTWGTLTVCESYNFDMADVSSNATTCLNSSVSGGSNIKLVGIASSTISNVDVYPTVTSGRIAIKAPKGSCVRVISLMGQLIKTQTSDDSSTVDLSELGDGIYFINVTNGFDSATFQIIKTN